jgi:hypothetical protein
LFYGLYVELDTRGRYYSDFIAIDISGTQWLIEGKSDHDVARRDVEVKRAAAEAWTRFVNDDGRFGTWRYLFCSETAIKNSHGGLGWPSRCGSVQPVVLDAAGRLVIPKVLRDALGLTAGLWVSPGDHRANGGSRATSTAN